MRLKLLALTASLGIGIAAALLWLLNCSATPVIARTAPSALDTARESIVEKSSRFSLSDATPLHFVAITGTDTGDCSTPVSACQTIQYAVDQAGEGDEIRVATGVYTSVRRRAAPVGYGGPNIITQVAHITKSVSICGGYAVSFTGPHDPKVNPTVLNAQGQGRVVFIFGSISVTVEGLHITGGDAAGLGGGPREYDAGGGVYAISATVTFSRNLVSNNNNDDWDGGGLYLGRSAATLNSNTITTNSITGLYLHESLATISSNTVTANSGVGLILRDSEATVSNNVIADNEIGVFLEYSNATIIRNTIVSNSVEFYGGGVHLYDSNATISENTIAGNTAEQGGGLYLEGSHATINRNAIYSNTASRDYGGGLCLSNSDVTISENTIISNTAAGIDGGTHLGGGLHSYDSNVILISNTISANTADYRGGGVYLYAGDVMLSRNTIARNTAGYGGGLFLDDSNATLDGNAIASNTADSLGGGLHLQSSDATLDGNIILSNIAHHGGGLYLERSAATLTNNVIVDNQISSTGSGLYIEGGSSSLLHNTIARNSGGDGSGVYVNRGSVAMTNTILVSHTVGITIASGNTATLEATLWGTDTWANATDWNGAGTVITGLINIWSSPDFVDPGSGDYHIQLTSPARDAGVDAGVTRDIDGQPRPMDWQYDIGADESGVGLDIVKRSSAIYLNPDQVFTYTVVVTSVGELNATGVILTDTLDGWQRVIAASASVGGCTITDGSWGGAAVCSLGTLITNTDAVVTLTAQVSGSVALAQEMSNTVVGKANETTSSAQITTYGQDCHVRINDSPKAYTSVQDAVDKASPGDVVKVAGYCLGISEREGLRQQIYLDKSLAIQGGYTTTDWSTSYPITQPTTLDALGRGRVLYITGDINPTVEGLRITGGDATGLEGHPWEHDAGGGVYISDSGAVLKGNRVFSNTADAGGGFYLGSSPAVLSANVVASNTAGYGGGGLYLNHSAATLSKNAINNNSAESGGGLFLYESPAVLNQNAINANVVGRNSGTNYGGGLYLIRSDAELSGNRIYDNKALGSHRGQGGGLYLSQSNATLSGNTIWNNVASGTYGQGGGVHLSRSDVTLINNIIADNQASTEGSGLYIGGFSPRLLHNTIARNTGSDGSGIYVANSGATYYATVALTNTILADHNVGLYISSGNTATLESTLWNGNTTNWNGDGTIDRNNDHYGDPAFVAPGAGNYHIGLTSAAIDKGIDTDTTDDIDGEPRPQGRNYDLGADETGLIVIKQADPKTVQATEGMTYTIHITNTANVTLTATVTDILPAHVTPTGVLTWASSISPFGGIWTETIAVTAGVGYAGPLTNVVRVVAEEGASGIYTHSATLLHVPGVVLAPDRAGSAGSGSLVTYTHTLTNIGNAPDVFNLTHHSNQGWPVAYHTPASVGFRQTTTVAISITVPIDAISSTVDTTVVTATSQASRTVQAMVIDTTTVIRVLGVELAPNRTRDSDPDTIVLYNHTLTNTGNSSDTFTLEVTSSQGWTAALLGGTPVGVLDLPLSLAPGGTATLQVSLTVPVDATSGTMDTTIVTVTSQANDAVQAVVTDVTTVNHIPGAELAPNHTGSGDPNTTVTYLHILTNTGNGSDIFDLAHHSSQGWPVTYDTSLSVGYGQTATVLVDVTIPAGATSGVVDRTTITAISRADGAVQATAIDTTAVNHVPSLELGPDRAKLTNPGNLIVYTHTLANTGNGPDTFNLMHRSSQGWSVTYDTPVSVGYDQTAIVGVNVIVPTDSGGLTDITVVTATSQADENTYAVVKNTTTVNAVPVADAGPDRYVVPSDAVLLDGRGSTDPDGHLPLTYRWRRTGGPFVILVDTDKAQAAFQAPPYQSVLTFTLTVTDTLDLSSSPDITVVYVGEESIDHLIYLPLILRKS